MGQDAILQRVVNPLNATVVQMTGPQRVALVTGASAGIGASCAAFLAAKGYRVYGGARSAVMAEGVEPLILDVTDDVSVARAIETILARESRLDVLVNNAGFGIAGAIEDTSIEEAREQFEVNFFGVLRMCRAVLPVMRRQKSGYIVNIGSIGGLIAIPFQGFYSATKFALEGFSESLRMEVRPFGIQVVLIEPGDHRTAFTQNRRATRGSARGRFIASILSAPSLAWRPTSRAAQARMESQSCFTKFCKIRTHV